MKYLLSILFLSITLIQGINGQICLNNPSIQAGDIDPAPLVDGEGGVLRFIYTENGQDYIDDENHPVRLTICLLNIAPVDGVNSVRGTYSDHFDWLFDPISNCYLGTQNQDIFGGDGGSIIVDFIQTNSIACPDNQMGFNANIQPAACMNGINQVNDDNESSFTCNLEVCGNDLTSAEICEMCNTTDGTDQDNVICFLDCDGGGISTVEECDNGTDPKDPCDDIDFTSTEICEICNTTDGSDQNNVICSLDCDGDGEDATTECNNGTDPTDACDNSYTDANYCENILLNPNSHIALGDCDNGGVSNIQECIDGTDPLDPCDDHGLTGAYLCENLATYGDLDCDGDGEDANTECNNGTDPLDPCSNSYVTGEEICSAISNGAIGLENVDCDNGGIDNEIECNNGGDPTDPLDDCDLVMNGVVDICALLLADPLNPMGNIDCDGDGLSNLQECNKGTDPTNPCSNTYTTGEEVCIAIDHGAIGLENVDCDNGGINDGEECDNGTDPMDATDDVQGSITGIAWHDENGDGVNNGTELGISNVFVYLLNGIGTVVDSTLTDDSGVYLFEGVYSGNYSVVFNNQMNLETTFQDIGDNDSIDSDIDQLNGSTIIFNVAPGENESGWNAGYYHCILIGETIWYDYDKDDVFDSFENGINGLEIKLWRKQSGTWELWETQYSSHKPGTPSDDGYYMFCAPPGEYYVEIVLPPYGLVTAVKDVFGYIALGSPTEQDIDSDINAQGETDVFVVKSGDQILTIGAGYYPQATVGNLVWHDVNGNGLQEDIEPRVENVLVKAFDANNELVGESITDEDGVYFIDELQKKDYYLKFEVPNGYSFTDPNVDEGNMDSDVDGSFGSGTTRLYSFEPDEDKINVDAGLIFGVLPVTWVTVIAERSKNESNMVQWTTTSELNIDKYEVYRSLNSINNFVSIGTVNAEGNNLNGNFDYELLDLQASYAGVYYYYIVSINRDGTTENSKIVKVNVIKEKAINLYPNPSLGIVNLEMTTKHDLSLTVVILNNDGKLVRNLTSKLFIQKGDYNFRYDVNELTSGVYTMKIVMDNEVINEKLIIVKK